MIDKKPIAVYSLQEIIKEFFQEVNKKIDYLEDELLFQKKSLLVKCHKDAFNKHIFLKLSLSESSDGIMNLIKKSLYIKDLEITGSRMEGNFDISQPLKFIDKLIFKDIEFDYGKDKDADCLYDPLEFTIITGGYISVELIGCIGNNDTPLIIKYNIPKEIPHADDAIKKELIVSRCTLKSLSVIAIYSDGTDSHLGKKNQGELKDTIVIDSINLYMEFSKNVFQSMTLDLSRYSDIKYEYAYNMKLINGNDIKELIISGEYPDVIAWGAREKIGESIAKDYYTKSNNNQVCIVRWKNFIYHLRKRDLMQDGSYVPDIKEAREQIENNKSVLMKFRKFADDKGDRFQESTINYHIATCDEQLVGLERCWGFIQDKAIMFLGRHLSRHGTSWVWPLVCISIFNFLAACTIYSILVGYAGLFFIIDWDLWHIFKELYNPLSTPASIVKDICKPFSYQSSKSAYMMVSSLVLLSKAFYAMCIYEFVRAARRFTLK